MVPYPVLLGEVIDVLYGVCAYYCFLDGRRKSPVAMEKWQTDTGLEYWQHLIMDLHIGVLGYWSLFCQLPTMVNSGSTSGD